MTICEKCLEDGLERTATDQRWGADLCGPCAQRVDEQAYDAQQESDFARYHGGSGPVTLAEQYQSAAKMKRELRQKS